MYIGSPQGGYGFYSSDGTVNNTTLAFNVYGIKNQDSDEENDRDYITKGSSLLTSGYLDEIYNINAFSEWNYADAPYILMDIDMFENKVITDIEVPVSACSEGSVMTVSVVKFSSGITETLATYTLTAERSAVREWMHFGGLDIEVPDGYTLAFGSGSDTLRLCYFAAKVPGYEFYNRFAAAARDICLAMNVYGK